MSSFLMKLLPFLQGYAGGDEVKMIQRHLSGTPTRIGVGANRSATAASIFRQHGYMKFHSTLFAGKLSSTQHLRLTSGNDKVAVAILDDGMQVLFDAYKFLYVGIY